MASPCDISLITSLYRSERYLQRYSNAVVKVAEDLKASGLLLELVIVANSASQREKKSITELSDRLAGEELARVIVLDVPRELLYASWNRGVKAASGNCLGFWNVDDLRNAEALSEGLSVLRTGAELVYFPVVEMTIRKRFGLLRELSICYPAVLEFDPKEFTRSMCIGPFFLFRRQLYEKVGPFDEQFRIVGDFEWAIRAAKVAQFRLCRSVGGTFIHDGTGLSGRGDSMHPVENNVVYLRHGVLDKVVPADPIMMRQYRIPMANEAQASLT